LEGLGEFDGGYSFLNGGVVTADQVGVRWDNGAVVRWDNGAVVPWFKCTITNAFAMLVKSISTPRTVFMVSVENDE